MNETLRTIFMGIAALIAVFSFLNTIRLWQKGNRPIVSAVVDTASSGKIAVMYNLVVINSGNRPAVNVRLHLDLKGRDFHSLVTREQKSTEIDDILKCFSKEGEIPLLINGERTSNAFGLTSSRPDENVWVHGIHIPIQIKYMDLDGKRYSSKLELVIKYSKSFAGSAWGKTKVNKNVQDIF